MDLFLGALCPACELGELEERYDDLDYKYVVIKNQQSFHCPNCGEFFCNLAIRKRIEKILTVARKELA
jgi:YgiT-type zinc finger domain-containing protein